MTTKPEIPDDVVERAAREIDAACVAWQKQHNDMRLERWDVPADVMARAAGRVFVAWERARLQSAVDLRMNNRLCEMKPDYDDAITGFNEAWEIAAAAIRALKEKQG